MKISNTAFFFALVILLLIFPACKDDDNSTSNDPESITTVRITFLPLSGPFLTFTMRPGGSQSEQDTIVLPTNSSYAYMLEFLDESNSNNVRNRTQEITNKSLEHLVCSSGTGVVEPLENLNTDDAGGPLGTMGSFATKGSGTGTLTIVLIHQPNKSSADPCIADQIDIQVTFDVVVQ